MAECAEILLLLANRSYNSLSFRYPSGISVIIAYVASDLRDKLLSLSLGESVVQLKPVLPLKWLHQSLAEAFLRGLSEQVLLFG